jgi:hypothetical protein
MQNKEGVLITHRNIPRRHSIIPFALLNRGMSYIGSTGWFMGHHSIIPFIPRTIQRIIFQPIFPLFPFAKCQEEYSEAAWGAASR